MLDKIKAKILEYKLNKIIQNLETKGRIEDALKKYRELLKQAEHLNEEQKAKIKTLIHTRIANIYMLKNNLAEARLHALQALNLTKKTNEPYVINMSKLIMASILYRKKKYKETEEFIDQILRSKPGTHVEHEIAIWARILRARILIDNKKCSEANQEFNKIQADLASAGQLRYILDELSILRKELNEICGRNNITG